MDKKIDRKMSWPKGYEPKDDSSNDLTLRLGLISSILKDKPKKKINWADMIDSDNESDEEDDDNYWLTN